MSTISKIGKSRFAGFIMLVAGGFLALLSGGTYAIYSIRGVCYAIYPGGECATGFTEGNFVILVGLGALSVSLVVAGLVIMRSSKSNTFLHSA